jgi:Hexameric tyrosine-coordinated heme protein (HTHP)
VQTLEDSLGTNYDFLSNVPTQIQEKIESRAKNEIISWINTNDLTSPLLADLETSNLDLTTISTDTTIGHDSFVFDSMYYGHFKCNLRRIIDHPNLWNYLKDLYQRPEFKATCNLDYDAMMLIAVGQTVATEFATIAAANNYWRK